MNSAGPVARGGASPGPRPTTGRAVPSPHEPTRAGASGRGASACSPAAAGGRRSAGQLRYDQARSSHSNGPQRYRDSQNVANTVRASQAPTETRAAEKVDS